MARERRELTAPESNAPGERRFAFCSIASSDEATIAASKAAACGGSLLSCEGELPRTRDAERKGCRARFALRRVGAYLRIRYNLSPLICIVRYHPIALRFNDAKAVPPLVFPSPTMY